VKLIIGSRGSKLALTQTHHIRDQLSALHADLYIEVEIISTTGDTSTGSLRNFGGQGVFTKELENALLDHRVDLAVHSLKDLPTQIHADLEIVATPPREDIRDVLIAQKARSLDELPADARVGTGSPRRQTQLRALRPDLELADIRGNLDTRINKVANGDYDAIILAAAGLHRLGWQEHISAYLPAEHMLPAAGQAALGLQMRRMHPLRELVAALDDDDTHIAVSAERSLLKTLRGGCHAPVAAWARCQGSDLVIDGIVGHPSGDPILRAQLSAARNNVDAEALGRRLAEMLRARGADALIQES
jgi:hydroxymethylbilane synthase